MNCPRCHAALEAGFKACPHCGEVITDFLRRYLSEPIDGKYEILERLGTGGMGEVYKVRHTYLGAMRVIKVIRPQIADNKDANDRFLREAQLATKVHHQNVATLHDFSALPDGSHYMVWEYIEGENLGQRLRQAGTLPARTAVRIAIDALHGLEAIHRAGIVHRDISPENLMLTRDGVKIIDLGVAKAEEVDGGTKTGIFVGKLRYASPEQLGFLGENEKIDGRADLYSLAIVLYEMLTGRPPFDAKSPHEYVLMHSRETKARPIEITQNLPGGAELQRILQRALESDRTKRFQSAAEFAAVLEAVETTRPLVAQPDDETMRVVGPVVPAEEAAGPTLRTPIPAGGTLRAASVGITAPGAPTVRTAVPPASGGPDRTVKVPLQTEVPERAHSGSRMAIIAVIALAIVLGGIAAAFFLTRHEAADETAKTAVPLPTAPAAAAPAQSSLDVTTTTAVATSATASAATVATTTAPAVQPPPATPMSAPPSARPAENPKPQPVVQKPVKTEPAEPALPILKYVDGEGDTSSNDAALRQLREQLSGVKSLALRGGDADLLKQLSSALQEKVTIASDADVTIDFNGTVERLGRGRKRRSATAVISKHGHPIFRYELPPEEYRVGDNPAEAFARVMVDALP